MNKLGRRRERAFIAIILVFSILTSFLVVEFPVVSAITWDPIEEISEDKRIEYQRYPAIAADAGKAYAVWADNGDKDYDIMLREHDGLAWQLEEEFNADDNSIDQWYPDVAVEGSDVHVVWQDPVNGDWDIMYRSRSGGVLGPIEEINMDMGFETQQNPRVAAYGGHVYVVWQDGRDGDWDIYFREHDGVSWGAIDEISIDSGTEFQTWPCVAVGGGRVYAVWTDAGGGDTDIVMRVHDGMSWGAITEVSQDATNEPQDEPDMTYDSGKLHVVWQGIQGADKDIFHRSWDGTSFSAIQEISIDGGVEFQDIPSVAAEFGRIHTVWADRGDGDWDIVYRQFDGSSWLPIEDVSTDGGTENQWNPYVATDNGVVHVVWEDQGDGDQDIFYRRGFEAPSADNTPPDIFDVFLDGQPSRTYPMSILPATISLTATVDDSARGDSVIGGANFTIGPGNWATSTMMMPDDFLDSSTEGFHYDVIPPTTTGTWQYCVYGWDIAGNYNVLGSCATLTIIDDLPPLVTSVLIDGFATRTIPAGTPNVFLTAMLDDSMTGSSNIGGANYTSPQKNWANSTVMTADNALDSPTEGFHATVDSSTLGFGSYEICAYGWDLVPNFNTDGACATLNVAVDTQPPAVMNVLINGQISDSYGISSIPALTLTGIVDDSATGNSNIGGANYTTGPQNWPSSAPLTPDNILDSSVEGFHAILAPPSTTGVWQYCVYGWDEIPNYNSTGSCAGLTIYDDLPPIVSNVLLDGLNTLTIVEGTVNVTLTATLDDFAQGASIIGGANYTSPSQNWLNSTIMDPDDILDSPTEGFHSNIGTLTLGASTYEICVYGWDLALNNNTAGSCATLIVTPSGSTDQEPPEISSVLIDGASPQIFSLSSLPSTFTLTALLDDSLTGGSMIGGANYTLGPQGWPGMPMSPIDGAFNEIMEDVAADVLTPSIAGVYDLCVYGFDQSANFNTTGECGTLVIQDDIPPDVKDVLVDSQMSVTVLPGTVVMLTGTIDDFLHGGSDVPGANYTIGASAWPSTAMTPSDGSFGESTEDVEASIDTTGWALGPYWLCVYGWDDVPNYNTIGGCAMLVIATDIEPPLVTDVRLNGQAPLTLPLSQWAPIVLTANVDDSTTGNSNILGANYSWDPPSWPDTAMAPSDGQFDSPVEDVQATVLAIAVHGTYEVWIEGCDEHFNCGYGSATLIIEDDLAPAISNVILDGQITRSILEGTANVTLTALVDDSLAGDADIGGANFTSPYLAWGNSTAMYPATPPLDDSVEVFEVEIDTHSLPAGSYEIWVYGWDSHNNLNVTPTVHATLVVQTNVTVDDPPSVEIVSVYPSEVEEGENVTVVIVASDDHTIVQVRVEVVDPDGSVVRNLTATYDEMHGGYELTLAFDEPGVYSITAWALDDGGNWASHDDTFEVLESSSEGQPNYKPVIALIFTLVLLLIGFLLIWKVEVDNKLRRFWFLPFAIAEGITGGVSAATGALSIPSAAGAGLALDLVIFLVGLSVPLLLLIRKLFVSGEADVELDASEDDIEPENTK